MCVENAVNDCKKKTSAGGRAAVGDATAVNVSLYYHEKLVCCKDNYLCSDRIFLLRPLLVVRCTASSLLDLSHLSSKAN